MASAFRYRPLRALGSGGLLLSFCLGAVGSALAPTCHIGDSACLSRGAFCSAAGGPLASHDGPGTHGRNRWLLRGAGPAWGGVHCLR
eukprot:7529879-Alexandrium_andersonii.AAC.1